MTTDPRMAPRPPRFLQLLARLLIRGRDASYILLDLEASFARDIERGLGCGGATRRYVRNVLDSVWNVWKAGLRARVTHGIGLDAKLGLRMLAKQPLITAVAVLALGLGIPASLTLLHAFDVVYGDLPVPEADRVLGIRYFDTERNDPRLSSVDDYEYWTNLSSFESLGAAHSYTVNLNATDAGAAPLGAAVITASSFDVLRARPLRGRVLQSADEVAGAPDVVLLGEDLWSTRFARTPDIVGKTVLIGRTPHTVVGIMPADFKFPFSNQVWLPYRMQGKDFPPGAGPRGLVFGRLRDGVSTEDARAEFTGLTERRANDDPERLARLVGEVVTMPYLVLNHDNGIWSQPEVILVQTLIFALLIVVCGNVGTLILARTAARSTEITIRCALGASRRRILTQLFVEALVLSAAATGLGLIGADVVAEWLMRVGTAPYDAIPYWADLTLTPRIVAIAMGLAALCAVLAGVLPAISATRRAIQPSLQRVGGRGGSGRFGIVLSLLIVGEIVLSVGFLAAGIARLSNLIANRSADLGFDPARYVVGTLSMREPNLLDGPSESDSVAWKQHVAETQRALLARLADDPAVRNVAMAVDVPGLSRRNRTVILETPPPDFEIAPWDVSIPQVDVSFFEGLNRPILAGRDFNEGDVAGQLGTRHTAVIVNESFVRNFLGGGHAIGQRLRYHRRGFDADEVEWYEIVGVVGAFGTNPQSAERDAAVYHPLAPGEVNPIHYVVETAGDPNAFLSRFRQISATVDPEAAAFSDPVAGRMRTEKTLAQAMFLFVVVLAGVAFLLSASGVYALMSFTVVQRTREIGIRTALGARTADIVFTVARRAAIQVTVGLGLGLFWGWMILDGPFSDVTMVGYNMPLTLGLTASVAGCVCVIACARPTLRGIRTAPTEALRDT